MKRNRWLIFGLSLLMVVSLAVSACGSNTSGTGSNNNNNETSAPSTGSTEPVEIKLVSAWPEGDLDNIGLELFEEKVAEIGQGRVKLTRAGGPETVPPLELAEAVRSGAVDMAWLHPAYYTTSLPEGFVADYSNHTWEEMLKNGAVDLLNKIHEEKLNVHVVGGGANGIGYSIYTNKPVSSIGDFKGMRIRATGSYLPFLEALQVETVVMPSGEIYGAMERGVIDGYASPGMGITARKLDEVTKYKVLPYFWQLVDISIMNLDKWNGLPDDVKEILTEAAREAEAELPQVAAGMQKEEDEVLKEQGFEIITIDNPDGYLRMAQEAAQGHIREIAGENAEAIIEKFFK